MLDRGFWESSEFKDEPYSEREAFLWLVCEAAWCPRRARVGSVSVQLERGECAFSGRFLAKAWSWPEPRVRRFLKRCVDADLICLKNDARTTHISICNYERFQYADLLRDAASTQDRRKPKKLRISSNEEIEKYTRANPSTEAKQRGHGTRVDGFEPEIAEGIAEGLTRPQADRESRRFLDHYRSKAGKEGVRADWRAVWRNWCRNAVERIEEKRAAKATGPPRTAATAREKIRETILRRHGGGVELHPREGQIVDVTAKRL